MGAELTGVDLGDADLTGADLRNASLNHVDVRGARGLTQVQLDRACGTNVKLPDSLTLKPCPPRNRSGTP
jgi:uncharacterized protein YjbI with pentapeptide repeats